MLRHGTLLATIAKAVSDTPVVCPRRSTILIDLPRAIGDRAGPLPSWIWHDGGQIQIAGDDSLSRQTYIAVASNRAFVTTSLVELADRLRADGMLNTSDYGVSHMLGTGFVPLPHTVYGGVYRLSAGDLATVSWHGDDCVVEFGTDCPWLTDRSRQDQVPSTDHLFSLIVSSLERRLAGSGGDGLMMMSSGKDSVALAIALAESGHDVPCVTWRASAADAEGDLASQICRDLGLQHRTIGMPSDPGVVKQHLLAYFAQAVLPSADHATIPFVVSVAESGISAGGIIDGGGNDPYMGMPPPPGWQFKNRYRIRGHALASLVARITRVDSPLNYLARPKASTSVPGRNLRNHEIRRLFPGAVDTVDYWQELSRKNAGMSDFEALAAGLLWQAEGARINDKVLLVAQARGMAPVLPFCDADLAEYCFHLPVSARYDEKTGTSKILLRQLLMDKIGYDAQAVGKRYFGFDGAAFVQANRAFVREEILDCQLWDPSVKKMVDRWLDAIADRPFLFHVLVPLFVVSGWHNHSRYLIR